MYVKNKQVLAALLELNAFCLILLSIVVKDAMNYTQGKFYMNGFFRMLIRSWYFCRCTVIEEMRSFVNICYNMFVLSHQISIEICA